MNIVLKNSLKNIFGKPFRTLLVVFAIFMCSLCAMLSFDLGESISRILTDYLGSVSRADIFVTSSGSDMSELPGNFPEADFMTATGDGETLYNKIDGEYCYVTTESYSIYGINVDEAVDMKFMSFMDIKDDEMFISKDLSEKYGYQIGDKVTVHDRAMDEIELTIGGIFPDDTKNPILKGNTALVNMKTSDRIACGVRISNILLVDILDDTKIEEAKDLIKEKYPDASITDLFLSDDDMALVNELKAVFYLMFVITFLLVVFVTASICNRIVSERMSFIGTLRSLGMSTARTGRILLLENVIYALLGSVPATVFYALVRNPIMNVMFVFEDGSGNNVFEIPSLSWALFAGVIIGAVLIECLIPLKAILKALKTSIRDIIFDNRDTEYKFSRSTFVFGLVCLALAIVTFIFRHNIFAAILCMLSAVGALAFLFPRLLKLVTSVIKKFSDKHDKAAWSLAAVEAVSRKSTVGSGVLCATASAMCIVVYVIATALGGSLSDIPYDCDVIVSSSKEMKYYSYIDHLDGVTDVEPLYCILQETNINDAEKSSFGYFYALPDEGFRNYKGFTELPESIEEGNIVVDRKFASKRGIAEGDTIKVVLNPNGVFPIEKEYTVQQIIENNASDSGVEGVFIREAEFKALFRDYPSQLLIKCSDPDAVKQSIETYGKGSYTKVQTYTEYVNDLESNNKKTMAVVTAIIVIALGMTTIGMISNLLIGFEGRKKECAVLLSTAMGKAKLSGILFKEVLITSITASAAGTVIGSLLTLVIKAALDNSEVLVVDIAVDPVKSILFFVLLAIVFTVTVLFPMRNLRKMKISEQIKYE